MDTKYWHNLSTLCSCCCCLYGCVYFVCSIVVFDACFKEIASGYLCHGCRCCRGYQAPVGGPLCRRRGYQVALQSSTGLRWARTGVGGQLDHIGGQVGHIGGQVGHIGGQVDHIGGQDKVDRWTKARQPTASPHQCEA